jgi:hypothetical protein
MKFSPLSFTFTIVALTILAADLAVPGYGQVLGKAEAQRFIAELMEGGVSLFARDPSAERTQPTATATPSAFPPSKGATVVDWNRTHESY